MQGCSLPIAKGGGALLQELFIFFQFKHAISYILKLFIAKWHVQFKKDSVLKLFKLCSPYTSITWEFDYKILTYSIKN